jgi:hypothetical protein
MWEILFLKSIQNPQQVYDSLKAGKIHGCLLNDKSIVDIFLLELSIFRASEKTLKTRTVYTEIIYNLSPSRNVTCFMICNIDPREF